MDTIATLKGSNLIAGGEATGGPATITAVNPTDGRSLAPLFHEATAREIDEAVQHATAAYRIGASREQRAGLLDAIADQIEVLGDALVDRVMAETGLPAGRVRGERGRTTGQLRLFASVVREGSWADIRIETALPDREPLPRPDLRTLSQPIGPVAVFGASNFPLAFSVAGGDTASALAAGCPVVCKAHPAHPGTSELVGRAITAAVEQTGLPGGWFSLVHGAGPEVGQMLASHPGISGVGFTGSLAAGRSLFDTASRRDEPIPVFAEMGSVNPVFLMPGALKADAEGIAAGLVGSVTLGAGQFCTNPGLVFVRAGEEATAFVDAVGREAAKSQAQTMLHQGIAERYREGVDRLSRLDGVERVAGPNGEERGDSAASACAFTTNAETFLQREELGEEVFGPSTVIVQCGDLDEMKAAARHLAGNLSATIHAEDEDLEAVRALLPVISKRVGRVVFNGFPTGVEVGHAMQHGGPYPATTAPWSTSVGTAAIRRWVRPVCYQDVPQSMLPEELHDSNPVGTMRQINGEYSRKAI